MLSKINIAEYRTAGGFVFKNLPLSFQVFGRKLGTAPVVLVCHALTGNSTVAGENGWWKKLIAPEACIDLNRFTVLAFDIPGNGYNGFLIKSYENVSIRDVAKWFLTGLEKLRVDEVYVGIGGSLGGSILWQMAVLKPKLFQHILPIATDWKATDWLLAQCRVQKQLLANSTNPVHDARIHAMTFYRTPESLKNKFNRKKEEKLNRFQVESWLLYHGEMLENRFHLYAYRLMNHLLTTANIESEGESFAELTKKISGTIHLVGIDSDGFYLNTEIQETYRNLKLLKKQVSYSVVESIHGHDAFLIEYEQLNQILKPIFKSVIKNKQNKKYEHEYIG